jgi:serine/threonine protein kinase
VCLASVLALTSVRCRDIEMIASTGNKHVVGAELAVSAMLSSLVRRNVCPNFVVTRRVFTCPYEPPKAFWGSEVDKRPKGGEYSPRRCQGRKPREPSGKNRSRYQYIRMELCAEGDAEEYLKRQPEESISPLMARNIVFQVGFAMHAAADRFSLKHYDLKLLNIFLQTVSGVDADQTTLRYGFGSHVFALEMPTASAIIAKVADYGTANVQAESNGQPATIGQFTTLENTPPEFMILGDAATQGHGHDAFGLGLCMLHLFTGHAPYEEILADVVCPSGLKAKLQDVWEDESSQGYSVIRSVILADVYKDEAGAVIEGEPDDTLYDTFYRYLVLFGIPGRKYKAKSHGRVWKAISSSFEGEGKGRAYGRSTCGNKGADFEQFERDQNMYSLRRGTNPFISRARQGLEQVAGGLNLLFSLVDFDPEIRATVCDVLNSEFMVPLREDPAEMRTSTAKQSNQSNHAISFMAYATK